MILGLVIEYRGEKPFISSANYPRLIIGLDDERSIQDLLWGQDAAAEDVTAVEGTAEDGTAENGMAELSEKGGRYGGIT